jgi:hypothetical protein
MNKEEKIEHMDKTIRSCESPMLLHLLSIISDELILRFLKENGIKNELH